MLRQVSIKVSDINVSLSKQQFHSILEVVGSVSRVLAAPAEGTSNAANSSDLQSIGEQASALEKPQPQSISDEQLKDETEQPAPVSLDLIVEVATMRLQLFDGEAFSAADFKEHGIAKLTLRNNTFRTKMLTDGALEIELVLQSITIKSLLAGNSKFRELIPPAEHTRNQFMLFYAIPSGKDSEAMLLLTVDSPECIFAPDPVRALLDFLPSNSPERGGSSGTKDAAAGSPTAQSQRLNMRIDLQDFTMTVLSDDCDINSPAIRLGVRQMVMTNQVCTKARPTSISDKGLQKILALTLSRLGMSLIQMNKSAEDVRFMDDLELAVSLDSSTNSRESKMAITVDCGLIVFRASYRDTLVISAIVTKMLEAAGRTASGGGEIPEVASKSEEMQPYSFSEKPRAIITKEEVSDFNMLRHSSDRLIAFRCHQGSADSSHRRYSRATAASCGNESHRSSFQGLDRFCRCFSRCL
jgi:vacuolar protein sorting-associated protein 13A/C